MPYASLKAIYCVQVGVHLYKRPCGVFPHFCVCVYNAGTFNFYQRASDQFRADTEEREAHAKVGLLGSRKSQSTK